ncbi:phosphoesterase [Mariprofundus sp. NF]|uniref:metallophosphoesterase family protein n=1 Tax=Mariprofundus sp. NF TaxID=2608716 RepID=UPI0015A004CC|nr:metallophosphoesterase family protein [Mariprofundus sp. NF]NWF39529.1 phosphoesterase [Mariprofundus sp. NF]
MTISIIGALSGLPKVTIEVITSLLEGPALNMSHGGDFTGKPSTQLHADASWVLKIDERRNFSTEEVAHKWSALQIEKERAYGIYHPQRCWFVIQRKGWVVGNISPRMQPLHTIDFSTLSSEQRLNYLTNLLAIYCRFAAGSEKRLDEGLSNFALLDDQLFYLDDDIYPWDSFSSFSAMLANWLRKSDELGMDSDQWQVLGKSLKPLLRGYSSSADDMVYEGLSDQFVGSFEMHKQTLISELRSVESCVMVKKAAAVVLQSGDEPIGMIADVHANLPAFESVLKRFAEMGVEQIMHLGDIVGYGPQPAACIRLAKEQSICCIRGNHDHYVAHHGDVKVAASRSAQWTLDWTIEQLDDDDRAWLATLPVRHRTDKWMAVHGSPIDKSFFNGYVYNMTAEKNLEHLRSRDIRICLHGHSHIQGVYAMQGSVVLPFINAAEVDLNPFSASLICPGSVGQPRDGQVGAEAAIFYPDRMRIELFTVPYDIEKVALEMQDNNFPERIVQRLRAGR